MQSYTSIAQVYDYLMSHVDYTGWVNGLEYQWRKLENMPDTVLDAGCGTGSVLIHLARRQHRVIGIDNSPEMLAFCFDKLSGEGINASLFEMDMRDFVLGVKVDAVICLCDTLNYFISEEEFLGCLKSFYACLKPGGSFIFDLRTPHYYKDILANNQWVQQEKDIVLIWENDFSLSPIIDINLTFFVKQKNKLFRKYNEIHRQKCYEINNVTDMIQETGFILKEISSDLKGTPLKPLTDERIYFITTKNT
jgi:SAM-dependent methyltransferase